MDTLELFGVEYRPRVVDAAIGRSLAAAGAVVIEGPRACGKTMSALNAAESYVFLDDNRSLELASVAPRVLLEGARPRLLDEWQLAPALWNHVRRAVDFAQGPGQFILTGSAVPADDVTRHTGAGRFVRIRQRTLSLWERGLSQGTVSLAGLFAGELPATNLDSPTHADVIESLVFPGFPAMQAMALDDARTLARGYLDEVIRTDLSQVGEVRHSPETIRQLLRALARATASESSVATITKDLAAAAPDTSRQTVSRYIELLERLFVVDRQTAWTPSLRSRARLRTSDRWHLADPGLAAAALGAGRDQLLHDPQTAGFLFESAVVHDLWVYAAPLNATVHHYRDSNGHEIDAIVVLPDGRWGAVEVKLGGGQAIRGMETLNTSIAQIESTPEFRLVITGTGATFTAEDGTLTCPLSALAP